MSKKGEVPLTTLTENESENTNSSEKSTLVEKQHRINLKTAVHYRLAIIILSWATVFFVGALGVTTFVLAIEDNSSAAFAFALDAILDCLSSLVVIWRYGGQTNTLYSSHKENIACITLSVLFFLSSASIITKSIVSLVKDIQPAKIPLLRYIFMVNGIVCSIFLVGKFFLGYKLESRAIITDAFNSLVGAVLAFTMLFGDLAYEQDDSVWVIDPIVGIVCAGLLTLYGIWILVIAVREMRSNSITVKN